MAPFLQAGHEPGAPCSPRLSIRSEDTAALELHLEDTVGTALAKGRWKDQLHPTLWGVAPGQNSLECRGSAPLQARRVLCFVLFCFVSLFLFLMSLEYRSNRRMMTFCLHVLNAGITGIHCHPWFLCGNGNLHEP